MKSHGGEKVPDAMFGPIQAWINVLKAKHHRRYGKTHKSKSKVVPIVRGYFSITPSSGIHDPIDEDDCNGTDDNTSLYREFAGEYNLHNYNEETAGKDKSPLKPCITVWKAYNVDCQIHDK